MPNHHNTLFVIGVLLACAVASTSAQTLQLLTNYPDAKCLDGSPGSFYHFPATNPAKVNTWVLFKQGGGACTDGPSCLERSRTNLGSSTKLPQVADVAHYQGILSRNCTINPTFCDVNLVHINYCDGFLYSGNRIPTYTVNGTQLYFRGRDILYSVLDQHLKNGGLNMATDVLLSGCSAGGYATFIHSDAVSTYLKTQIPTLKKIRAAPLSGFFLTHSNIEFAPLETAANKAFSLTMNVTASLNPKCLTLPVEQQWTCVKAPVLFSFSTVPTFVVNSKMDHWQIACMVLGGHKPNDPNAYACLTATSYRKNGCGADSLSSCTSSQMLPLLAFQTAFTMRLSEIPAFRRDGNGMFIDSCLTHCAGTGDASWSETSIEGVSMQQAVTKWWLSPEGSPASEHSYVDCDRTSGADCNPSCKLHPWKSFSPADVFEA